VTESPSDLVQGTLDMLIPKNAGSRIHARIRNRCPAGTDEQRCFPPQWRVAFCSCAAAATRWPDSGRMEGHGEQQAGKVLRFNRKRAKAAQQRNTRTGKAGCSNRQNLGGVVSEPCHCCEASRTGYEHCSEWSRLTRNWTKN
jgi:hypothetical protein